MGEGYYFTRGEAGDHAMADETRLKRAAAINGAVHRPSKLPAVPPGRGGALHKIQQADMVLIYTGQDTGKATPCAALALHAYRHSLAEEAEKVPVQIDRSFRERHDAYHPVKSGYRPFYYAGMEGVQLRVHPDQPE